MKERVERAIRDIAEGRFVVVQDDWDRENEADIIVAAEKVQCWLQATLMMFFSLPCLFSVEGHG